MSKERNNPHFVAESDPLVTRVYREVADERVPDKLNQAVLRQAAAAGPTRYWRSISWTRPMAWVATITICVALVLEITRVPPPNGAALDSLPATFTVPEPEPTLELDRFDDAAPESLPESVVPAPLPGRAASNAPTAPAKVELMKKSARPLAAEPVFQERKRDVAQQAPVENRLTAAQEQEAPACDESATAKPETWLECIDELEKAGLDDEARRQRTLFENAFPGFDSR